MVGSSPGLSVPLASAAQQTLLQTWWRHLRRGGAPWPPIASLGRAALTLTFDGSPVDRRMCSLLASLYSSRFLPRWWETDRVWQAAGEGLQCCGTDTPGEGHEGEDNIDTKVQACNGCTTALFIAFGQAGRTCCPALCASSSHDALRLLSRRLKIQYNNIERSCAYVRL